MNNNEEIQGLLATYERKSTQLKNRINDITWYMNGAISRTEAWVLSPAEQDYFVEKINERLKLEAKRFT